MKKLKIAAAALAALVAVPAIAADTWVGSANYGAGAETVGPFNTYDFSSGGVLLIDPTSGSSANGYYQSFVTEHLLDGISVANPVLDNSQYEITVVANFTSQLLPGTPNSTTYEVTGGSFSLWLDKTPDHNFTTDTGFSDSVEIMKGSVLGGGGSNFFRIPTQQTGGGDLQLRIDTYDKTVFEPDTIGGGDSIFTLRLGAKVDKAFLDPITSVQGHAVGTNGLKFAADGNLILTPVPEPESYAMLLAGLGIIGAIARRRTAR